MIRVQIGELTTAAADALVRPVSTDFSPVTPTMRRLDDAAGPVVAEQCGRLGELPLGSAAITAAGGLEASFIIHVAVRSSTENAAPATVRRGLLNALRRAVEWEIDTLAIAPLGTGAGNLDAEEAAAEMVPVLGEHMGRERYPRDVSIVVENAYQQAAFSAAARRLGDGAEAAK